jgi:hypothetical protein
METGKNNEEAFQGLSEETIAHLKKMETALNNIVDPAVKEYLLLLKLTHDADIRFLCQSLNNARQHLGQRIRDLKESLTEGEEQDYHESPLQWRDLFITSLRFLREGKRKFSPNTTNSDVDLFLAKYKYLLGER